MKHNKDLTFNAKLNGTEKFGLRKLSIGLVAVALGTSFALFNDQTVKAADQNPPEKNNNQAGPGSVDEQSKLNIKTTSDIKTEEKQAPSKNITPASQQTPEKSASPHKIQQSQQNKITPTDPKNVTVTSSNTSNMMANNTSGNVHINVKNAGIYKTNDQASISISNPNNLLNFNNNAPSLGKDFSTSTDGKGNFSFTYTGKTTSSFSNLDLDLSIIGNDDTVKQYINEHHQDPTNIPVNVSVNLPNIPTINKDFTVTIHPYADKVQKDELMHGFIMEPKVTWTPVVSDNTRTQDDQKQIQVGQTQSGQAVYVDQNQGKVENGTYLEDGSAYTGPETSALEDLPASEQDSARLYNMELTGTLAS